MNNSIFFEKYNVTSRDLETYLAEGLSRGGDYADLYFESSVSESVSMEEGIVKRAGKSVSQGVGVRATAGEKTGFAYSDEIDTPALLEAARSARAIARDGSATSPRALVPGGGRSLYSADDPIDGAVANR